MVRQAGAEPIHDGDGVLPNSREANKAGLEARPYPRARC